MIPTLWNRFQWKTTSSAAFPPLVAPFVIRYARPEEKNAVLQVALLSLKMNTDWHDATTQATLFIHEGLKQAFLPENDPTCVVIAHGQRIIGVSMFDPQPEAATHLLSGPWVVTEYRNRGFGTALLQASLTGLAERGVTEVCGITRTNTVVSRFVYPKFGGIASEYTFPLIKEDEK
ncbi:MAG: hypothetical protein A3F67_08680 [Verrucomicrobia bacterium RIFCSPHIGHO2_12_FULL_41_10]|nr:MAG: hypothetical protein A3F67_08680 [Verrucomicrobia bacterium RIFCSPHIGHO2_12_FULL_41_10]HLB32757.1 GNAT family N-acetyltransferase [Chthoniobacterales bacterium]